MSGTEEFVAERGDAGWRLVLGYASYDGTPKPWSWTDCELSNSQRLAFHLDLGSREANRIICFTKKQ